METFLKVLGLLRHLKQRIEQWCERSPPTDLTRAQIPASGRRRCATSKPEKIVHTEYVGTYVHPFMLADAKWHTLILSV